ncbi:hypothetical protein RHM65_22210 [Pseudomonas sp. CCI4.2]|uniref:DUF4376 domain-containing protein n=1 Tax=Pseudomonas sp. CCI4.2 TaxID=3048620 RepID=UPI002AC94640|nr:hypothetical protein [Pseudomonas sp. CCI4.2]MEB0090080.1 hypothetical protein [Pseudomonas sp. CCI4.2]WPX53456.1 hypothetical protein RHM65_22210 [Pseudomonas sp. CCI4.2]
MTTLIVYQTNHLGVYVGPIEAEPSPLEPEVFLIPGGCVTTPPPEAPEFKAACWSGKAWQLLDYFNGLIVYNTASREALTLSGPGAIPHGYTVKTPGPGQVWKYGKWVDDLDTLLAKLYGEKRAAINSGCATHIGSGFYSDALGPAFGYDSALEDQVNLTGAILSGLSALCACHDPAGDTAFIEHSAEQLHRVGQHQVTFKQTTLQQAERLKTRLAQALADRDLVAMKAIAWSPPA